jgi:hypothetical protein
MWGAILVSISLKVLAMTEIIPTSPSRLPRCAWRGQQHGHHALLDLPPLGQFLFQRGDFGVHVAQDFGDGGLFE